MKLSAFEMSMYLAQMLDPESKEYSVNAYFEIAGVGEKEVERAVREMVANRECLRSYYGRLPSRRSGRRRLQHCLHFP